MSVYFGIEFGYFGDIVGVVCDWFVGVDGELDVCC